MAEPALEAEHQSMIVGPAIRAREVDLREFTTRPAEVRVGAVGARPYTAALSSAVWKRLRPSEPW